MGSTPSETCASNSVSVLNVPHDEGEFVKFYRIDNNQFLCKLSDSRDCRVLVMDQEAPLHTEVPPVKQSCLRSFLKRNAKSIAFRQLFGSDEVPKTDSNRSCLLFLQLCHLILFVVFFCLFLRLSDSLKITLGLGTEKSGEDGPKSMKKRSILPPAFLDQSLQGLEAIQMVGAIPTLQIKTNGTIGPWSFENNSAKEWAELSRDGTELRILRNGMYFINVQIFYLTAESSNSYEILRFGNKGEKETLSICANQAASSGRSSGSSAEVTCCTAVISHLMKNQRLRLHQIEQNRVILFSRGFSHWGVIKIQGEG